MKIIIALVLLQAGWISPVKYYEMSRTIEMEKGRLSRDFVDVDIQSHIPGLIIWTVTDRDTFKIDVKLKASDPAVFDEVEIDFLYDWKSIRFFSSHDNPQAITVFKNGGMYHQVGICGLLFSLVVFSFSQGGKLGVVCSLIICLVLVHGSKQVYLTTEIQINSPRNQSYRNVHIFINGGKIRADHILAQANTSQLWCSTISASDKGCPSCCHDHGVCQENRCLCDDDWSDEDSCQTQTSGINTLLVNPSDSRLTISHYSNGDNLTTFGKRQFDGTPKSVDILKHRKPNDAQITVHFDDQHRIKTIYSSNGNTIDLKWRNDCRVYITALTSSRKYQANIDVRMCEQILERKSHGYDESTKSNKLHLPPRSGRPIRVERDTLNNSADSFSATHETFHWPFVHVPIFVSRCGKPENLADVYVLSEFQNEFGEWVSPVEHHAVESGTPGMFYIKIPNEPAMRAKQNLENGCPSIGPPVMNTCSTFLSTYEEQQSKICGATEKTFKYLKGAQQTEINDTVRTCKAGFQTVVRYCKTMDFTPFTAESDCAKMFNKTVDVYTNKPLLLTPVAVFGGCHLVRGPALIVNVSESMGFLPKVLEVKDERPHLEITSIAVTPNDPTPLERYDVSTDYVCGTPTTEINMEISGSDGYRNKGVCNGVSSCSCCVLKVAGAAELVVDDVTVSVSDHETNYNFTRQIIVIF